MAERAHTPSRRRMSDRSLENLQRLLLNHGMSEREVERGMDYVVDNNAATTREGFVLALSRIMYSDEELADGLRYTFTEEPTPGTTDTRSALP